MTTAIDNTLEELDLLDHLCVLQNNIELEINQNELTQINKYLQNSSNDKQLTLDSLNYDHHIFGNVFKKIKIYFHKSNEETFHPNLFIDLWNIIDTLLNLIETNLFNLTDKDVQTVENGCYLLSTTKTIRFPTNYHLDFDYIKQLLYKYSHFLDRNLIESYLKDIPLPNHLMKTSCLLVYIIARPACHLHYLARFYTSLKDKERSVSSQELLRTILYYLNTNFCSKHLDDIQNNIQTLFLSLLANYTDVTMHIPLSIQAGIVDSMIDLLQLIIKNPQFNIRTQELIVTIIYNISRHDQGIECLNQLNTSDFIAELEGLDRNKHINMMSCMILALLSTPEQIRTNQNQMTEVLDDLLEFIYNASLHHNFQQEAFHISEMLIVFVKLFCDDRTVNYILEQAQLHSQTSSTIQFFIDFFLRYYPLKNQHDHLRQTTLTALVNIFWSISFQDTYKQILANSDPKFEEYIKNLTKETDEYMTTKEYIPTYLENIHKASTCLLQNLNQFNPHIAVRRYAKLSVDNEKRMIMLSYSHDDRQFCQQLYDYFIEQGYKIWVDFNCLQGSDDLWEEIAHGMIDADMICCLISESYCKSKSCRQEAVYALEKLTNQKAILPIYLQRPQVPPWLDIRISTMQYIRFKDLYQLEQDKLLELSNFIENKLSKSTSQPMLSAPADNKSSLTTIPKDRNKSIEQWDESDISKWFEQNQILSELKDLCQFENGHDLIIFTNLFLQTEKLQYENYSKEFSRADGITKGQKPLLLHEFVKFSNALRKLQKSFK